MQKDIIPILIPSAFMLIGILIIFIPAKSILKWDRKTGYRIYLFILNLTQNENKAIRVAGIFYKIFGTIFTALGILVLYIFEFKK